jgi:PadR family transcriptional regulator, regulatory protein PadR
MRRSTATDVLHGTLDLLVLKALSLAPLHGWGISQRIQQLSRDALTVGQGSLYPALYRLERKSLIKGEWGSSENNREAKYYQLTAAGRRALEAEMADWSHYSAAVNLVLAAEG